jgi:hypothetical protein
LPPFDISLSDYCYFRTLHCSKWPFFHVEHSCSNNFVSIFEVLGNKRKLLKATLLNQEALSNYVNCSCLRLNLGWLSWNLQTTFH